LRNFCTGDRPVLADVKSIYDRQATVDARFSIFRL
jgi:UDP-N-acetyl-D-galactosamine dehydrogenase